MGVLVIILTTILISSSKSKTTGLVVSELSEKERFIKLQAELTCDLASSSEGEDALNTIDNIESYTTKYGFTADEITSLQTKYQTDISIQQSIISEMKIMCPEFFSQFAGLQ